MFEKVNRWWNGISCCGDTREIEEFKNLKIEISSFHPVRSLCLKTCCHLCLMPKQGKTTEICQTFDQSTNHKREKIRTIPITHSLLELCGNTTFDVDSGSLWLREVLWEYLLASDFPWWKDVEQYLLYLCQILFTRPKLHYCPGNTLLSCKDHQLRHLCTPIQKSVPGCKWGKGCGDSALKIEVQWRQWRSQIELKIMICDAAVADREVPRLCVTVDL